MKASLAGADKQNITRMQREHEEIIEKMKIKIRGLKTQLAVANAGPSIEDQMMAANSAAQMIGDPRMFKIYDGDPTEQSKKDKSKKKKKKKKRKRNKD